MKALAKLRWGYGFRRSRHTIGACRIPSSQRRRGADPRLERLIYATSALITELSLDGVLQRVVQVAAEVIGAHYAAIGVLAPDGRVLESFTTHGISDEVRARIGPPPRGHGILGLVIREARARSGSPT